MEKETISKKQKKALEKPCPKCHGVLGVVGDMGDFDHDIVCHVSNESPCPYTMDFWGNTDY